MRLGARTRRRARGPKHGAAQGALGASRPEPGIKPKDLLGIPWRLAFALRENGWYLRQEVIWHKQNPMPESVADRFTRAHEQIFLLSKRARYYFDQAAISEPSVYPRDPGNLRPVRVPPHERQSGLRAKLHEIGPRAWRNRRDVWSVASQTFRGEHFAVFPEKLITPCLLAGSAIGDTVLDPFMGSGTTARVARQLQRYFIDCELNRRFVEAASLFLSTPKEVLP
ncbi:MAG: site-specific DNA-methyltransferase [Candidatus Accumulibacter sp.]|jgi:site-specific DNA-methyltransferase (cytosine-N4-specific)|nr:site-specific DNA-methyltransferase [Accumulibacter sp.]